MADPTPQISCGTPGWMDPQRTLGDGIAEPKTGRQRALQSSASLDSKVSVRGSLRPVVHGLQSPGLAVGPLENPQPGHQFPAATSTRLPDPIQPLPEMGTASSAPPGSRAPPAPSRPRGPRAAPASPAPPGPPLPEASGPRGRSWGHPTSFAVPWLAGWPPIQVPCWPLGSSIQPLLLPAPPLRCGDGDIPAPPRPPGTPGSALPPRPPGRTQPGPVPGL
jgi:hypothetical protein